MIILAVPEQPVDISNFWLNVIIGVSTFIIAVLAFGTELGAYKQFSFFKSLAFRGVILFIFSMSIIWFTIIKDSNNEIIADIDNKKRDSAIKANFDLSLVKSSQASAKTLAKYYLKYDSTQQKLERIVKDSSKTQIVKFEKRPYLDICDGYTDPSKDTINIHLKLCATQDIVYDTKFRITYLFCENSVPVINDKLFIIKGREVHLMQPISTQAGGTEFIEGFIFRNKRATYKNIYIYIVGEYKNENEKRYNLKMLWCLDMTKQRIRELYEDESVWIKSQIK